MEAAGGSQGNPHFATESEALVWDALRSQLQPGEIVLTGLRFSDVKYGDVEADMIVIFPDAGAVVLEIKGGSVVYANGEYRVESGRGTRRAHPFAQARKAKHALRRFLDRQPEWQQPLLRTEWMVALPFMDVEGDIGPEGRRDLIADRGEMANLRNLMCARITSPLNSDPYPTGDWADTALTVLMRFKDETAARETRPSGGGVRNRPKYLMAAGISALVLAALAAFMVSRDSSPQTPPAPAQGSSEDCNANYSPCLPLTDDLDCPDIGALVTVLKEDPYGLDRDGDGFACETFAVE